jgi:hypothetical protein
MSRGERTVAEVIGFKLPLADDETFRRVAFLAGMSPGALARTVVIAALRGRSLNLLEGESGSTFVSGAETLREGVESAPETSLEGVSGAEN